MGKNSVNPIVREEWLKELGLTISLGTGYKLSPRGEAFIKHLDENKPEFRSYSVS